MRRATPAPVVAHNGNGLRSECVMGSAWSRKQVAIDEAFAANPCDVHAWDLYHVRLLHRVYKDDGYDFGIDEAALKDLLGSALPPAASLAETFWATYAKADGQDFLYTLELLAALALQCHGLSRDKAIFFFELLDFDEAGSVSYDELAILISTAVGALAKVCSSFRPLKDEAVDKLADDVYVSANRDIGSRITLDDFLKWVEGGLKLNLGDVVERDTVPKALGMGEEPGGEGGGGGAGGGGHDAKSK